MEKMELEVDQYIKERVDKYLKRFNITANQFMYGALEVLLFEAKDINGLWHKQKANNH